MIVVVVDLTEVRSGAVSGAELGGRLVGSTETHVVPCTLGIDVAGEVAILLEGILAL